MSFPHEIFPLVNIVSMIHTNFLAGLFFFMPLRYNKEENKKVNHIRNLEGLSRFGHVSDEPAP